MKNKQFNELAVCGLESVRSISRRNSHLITRLYFTESRRSEFYTLCKELAECKKPYNVVENYELEKLCGSTHHEGVVAMIVKPIVKEVTFPLIQNLAHEKKHLLILDRISNANNLGAIVRSAAFFGFNTIILSSDDAQSTITTATYRIAKGGMDFVNIYKTESINRLLSDLKGKFASIGTDVRTEHTIQNFKSTLKKKQLDDLPCVLVLGNEEHGLNEVIKKACDVLVKIPGNLHTDEGIESLNVAQASSVLMYEISK